VQMGKLTIDKPEWATLPDLALNRYGSKIVFASDNWFATASNLTKPEDPIFIDDKFTEYGKWMDGWESRRKRIEGHDYCVIKLGLPGVIHGVEVNTAFFSGNFAPRVSIQAACLPEEGPHKKLSGRHDDAECITPDLMGDCATADEIAEEQAKLNSAAWTEIVPFTPMRAGYEETRHHFLPVSSEQRWTHVRLNIYPDGGVARLKIHGTVQKDWSAVKGLVDLAAVENGGVGVACSDAHYGAPGNLVGPGRSINMGDGWETARHLSRPAILKKGPDGLLQVPDSDWAVLQLGAPGTIETLEVDTNWFKGNFPESTLIEACLCPQGTFDVKTAKWTTLLPRTKLEAHKRHWFKGEQVKPIGVVSHLRVTIYPDGGISRIRAIGRHAPPLQARL